MIDTTNLDILIENKEFKKINKLLFDEFKSLFIKLTNTQNVNLSFMNLILLMKEQYPEISNKLDFLNYILSEENQKDYEKTYKLLNLYINFVKFYSM